MCLALVRNPLPVLASWQTVAFPVHGGRVPAGEAFDPVLRQRLDGEPDVLRRQLIVLDWFFERFEANLPHEDIIRYEDLVSSGGLALFRRLGHPGAERVALESGNASRVYDGVNVDGLLTALLEAGGAWTRFYPPRPRGRRGRNPPRAPRLALNPARGAPIHEELSPADERMGRPQGPRPVSNQSRLRSSTTRSSISLKSDRFRVTSVAS